MSKRTIQAEDLYRFQWLSNPVLRPDGQWAVFECMSVDEKQDDYETQLWLARTDGAEFRPLTTSGTHNHGAVWSPDGDTLAFVSNRAYGTQVWLLPMQGGEARRLTRFRYAPGALAFAPDGRSLYALVPVPREQTVGDVAFWDEDLTDKEVQEQMDKENKEWADNPKRYDRLYYKGDGVGLSRKRVRQLVAIDVETGVCRQLTWEREGVSAFSVAPDGKSVAYTTNRRDNPDVNWWYEDIYQVPADGGEARLLCADVVAHDLAYSPDGRYLAVLGHGEELYKYWSAAHTHLFLVATADGGVTRLTGQFPDEIGDATGSDMHGLVKNQPPVWSRDNRFIYVLSAREGRCEVVRFATDGSTPEGEVVIGGDRDVYGFASDGGTRFVVTYGTPTHPGKVVSVGIAGVPPRPRKPRAVTEAMDGPLPFFPEREVRLDRCNTWLDEVALVEPEPFYYKSGGDWTLQGWVMKPARFESGKRYPVILEIHGGPQTHYGYAMFHEMQWLAAQGYAVVYTNPRGGTSYGQEFVNAVRHHYGEDDAADVLNGLEAALSQFDFLDGERVAVTGGSYGGFMTNWLIGHTQRFFAAVTQRSISNWISFYGCSDIGPLFVESQLGVSDVIAERERLWQMSPLAHAAHIRTPLLILHSENDLRCPMEQAEQLYTTLKRRGAEVELLRIPNASHGLSRGGKPKLRVARLQAIFGFIDAHLPDVDSLT
ncbi:S9 family peptidase [Alicyclobacillus shizuokensis]|uniref:S9 family peptidase n=1 Tax=Alicyclobacillus shizuokensis TaxID=392014 RepID=UPI00082E92D2|nr:S9 family peptidase [Alicyclobacillus shizuokensis]